MERTMRLKDKIAIVTGGGSGIGQAIAQAYAREGATIVVADVNEGGAEGTVAAIAAAGGKAVAIRTDVSMASDVQAMVDACVRDFGRIDILVNVAGIITAFALLDTTEAQWDETLDVNLKGTFLCLQAAARVMAKQGHGVIINTTSVLGRNARPKRAAYCASKAGIILLTQTAAMELGPLGIRVNAIAPGSIETPLVLSAPISPEALARKIAAIPLQRRGDPVDLTGPALFLASDESTYVTGDIMTVDGGMTAGIE
jgi:NAD(P)-dependent dehydrogenase (short-subunit alcohol dehydrogenase family)